jgi:hypothetical protein
VTGHPTGLLLPLPNVFRCRRDVDGGAAARGGAQAAATVPCHRAHCSGSRRTEAGRQGNQVWPGRRDGFSAGARASPLS